MTDNSHNCGTLLVAMELSNSKWRLAFSGGDKIRQKVIEARRRSRFLDEVRQAKEKLGLSADTSVLCCYEAGRDGFWIYRWLKSEGIGCLVVDPASIEVNRRKRRAKTDRLDAESLVRLLQRYQGGDRYVWSVVHIPEEQQEDELRLHRELERLKKERTAHRCRIKSLLILHGISMPGILTRLEQELDKLICWNGKPLPEALRAELHRELKRLSQVNEQIKLLEKQKIGKLKAPQTNADRQAAELIRLNGVGEVSAWVLAKEFFGWRDFKNRREVGALSGLTPTPYDSGGSRKEQGISKAGNPRIRRVMIELAWCWVRFQPESELTKWFEKRFAHGSGRMRRVGITALARKLLVALWKYVEFGMVPEGAIIR
jgi:transposase